MDHHAGQYEDTADDHERADAFDAALGNDPQYRAALFDRDSARENVPMARAGLMPQATAQALAEAYVFLRRVEHRIQYLDDQQTHILPTQDGDLGWIAATLGFSSCCPFLSELDRHRELVAQEFDKLLGGAKESECKGCNGSGKSLPADFEALLEQLPGALRDRVKLWSEHPRVSALRDDARTRLIRLVQRTAQWVREGRVTELAAVRLVDWIEPLLRRESYLAMLLERPSVHERLLRMLGAARWPARYLLQHPGVIDELASDLMLDERFSAADFDAELEDRRKALRRTGEDDEEGLLNLLRRAHHAEVFRTLVRDVEGRLSVEQVADDLSALADAVLRVTARWCWTKLRNRHRDDPLFGIVGYGKLGGKELGYGSDLDIVFVYEDDEDPERYLIGSIEEKRDDVDVISPMSPLGEALMGSKVGDEVSYEAPGGLLTVTIVEIER